MTRLINVSSLGASFYLEREFQVGRLILLTIPMPSRLRSFDHLENQYRVWAVVRHCNFGPNGNHIGVAFVGKSAPRSYFADPTRLYRLNGVDGSSLWVLSEIDEEVRERRYPRYAIPIDVNLMLVDESGGVVGHERTVTENISLGGAAVFSNLPLSIGDRIRVSTDSYRVTLEAVVRNVRCGADGLPRIHLQFDENFPLEGIEMV